MSVAADRENTNSDIEVALHATCVAFGTHGVLMKGQSGTGKSALALQLIGLGATLVSDDLTRLTLHDGMPVAHAPPRLAGIIEARKIGLLRLPFQAQCVVRLCVDMDQEEQERLPHRRVTDLLGVKVLTIYKVSEAYFAAAVVALVKGERYA